MAKRFKQSVVDSVPHLNEAVERMGQSSRVQTSTASTTGGASASTQASGGKRFKQSAIEAIRPRAQRSGAGKAPSASAPFRHTAGRAGTSIAQASADAQAAADAQRRTTPGGFYSMPDFGTESQRLERAARTAQSAMQQKETQLQSAYSAMTELEKSAQFYSEQAQSIYNTYLQNRDPAWGTLFERASANYERANQEYGAAADAFSSLYAEYEPLLNTYNQAAEAYNSYTGSQQEQYGAWRGTIRGQDLIQQDITAADASIQALEEQKRSLNSTRAGMNQMQRRGGLDKRADIAEVDRQIQELDAKMRDMEEAKALLQEELEWSRYFRYADLTQAADFAELSQYRNTANGREPEFNAWSGLYTETGFEDIDYDIINRNEDAMGHQMVNDVNTNASFLGLDNSERRQMTDEEIAIFNYLYAQDAARGDAEHTTAYAYIDYLTGDLNYRQRQEAEQQWAEYARENPAGSSVFSVITSPLKGLSYIGQIADYAEDGAIDQNAGYNRFSYMNRAIRDEVTGIVEENWGGVGSFAYNTGMSMADFLFNTAVSGGNQGMALAIMGTGAAADTTIEAKDRGLSDGQAFALGTIAGAAEVFTEKFSLDKLLNADWEKGALKYILTNAFTEGAEEVGSDIINLTADILIAKDKSQWQAAIHAYMEQGMSEGEAMGKALADQAMQMGLDFLGGAISGGVMSGGASVGNAVSTYSTGRALNNMNLEEGDLQAIIQEGLDSDPSTRSHREAVKLQQQMQQGKTPGTYQLGSLYRANIRAIDAENQGTQLLDKAAEELERKGRVSSGTARSILENVNAVNTLTAQAGLNLTEDMSQQQRREAVKQAISNFSSSTETAAQTEGVVLPTAEDLENQNRQAAEVQTEAAVDTTTEPGMLPTAEQLETRQRMERAGTGLERSGIQAGARDADIRAAQRLSNVLGRSIRFYDGATRRDTSGAANGYYSEQADTIYVNSRSRNPVAQIISHELTHSVEAAEAYNDLSALVLERIRQTGGNLEQMRREKAELYARNGERLAEKGIDQEIVAQYVERYLLTDERSIRELTRQNRSLGQRILSWLNELMARLGSESARERAFVTRARDIYARALQETQSSFSSEQPLTASSPAHAEGYAGRGSSSSSTGTRSAGFPVDMGTEQAQQTRPAGETGRAAPEAAQERRRRRQVSEVDQEAQTRRSEEQEALEGLREDLAAGRITEEEFDAAMDAIMEQEGLAGGEMLEYPLGARRIRMEAELPTAAQYSIDENYQRNIDDWDAQGRPDGEVFVLGATGDVLQGLGAMEQDIYLRSEKVNTILRQHPEMTLAEIRRIPEILDDPVLVLKSRNAGRGGQQNTRLVLFGTVRAENGQPVLTVLDLRPVESGLAIDDMQKVNSAYTRNNGANFVRNSEVMYADEKRTTPLLRSIGLTIASRPLLQSGSVDSVLDDGGSVNAEQNRSDSSSSRLAHTGPEGLLRSGYMGSITYRNGTVNLEGVPFDQVVDTTEPQDGGRRYSFGGVNANRADLEALNRAQEMERQGVAMDIIFRETGWYTGADGKWRFEIDDSGMEFRRDGDARMSGEPEYRRMEELTEKWSHAVRDGESLTEQEQAELEQLQERYSELVWEERYRLDDFLKHDALFRAYPRLRGVSLAFDGMPSGEKGYFSPRSNTIVLSDTLFGKEPDVLLHEIQHILQRYEGFARGSSPGYWNRRMEEGYSRRWSSGEEMMPGELYRNTAGEIEARDAAARRELTAEERRDRLPDTGNEDIVFAEEAEDWLTELDAEYGPQLQGDLTVSEADARGGIERAASMEPVASITGEEFRKGETDLVSQVEQFFNEQGNRAYHPELGEVVLDRRGVKSDIGHGIGRKKAAAFAAVPEVIAQGQVVDYQKNWKGRGYDTAVIAAPIEIGGQPYLAGVVLTRSNLTNRFYLHEVLAENDGAAPFKTGAQKLGKPGGDTPSVASILEEIRAVKHGTQSEKASAGAAMEDNQGPAADRDIRYSIREDGTPARGDALEDERVFTTPSGAEVVRNPTDQEYQQLRAEAYQDYPWLWGTGEPVLRHTYDRQGNEYYWRADQAVHAQVEPYINQRYGTQTSQQWQWWTRDDADERPTDYGRQYSVAEEAQLPTAAEYPQGARRIRMEAELPTAAQEESRDIIGTMPVKAQAYLRRAESYLTAKVGNLLSVPRYAQREYLRDIVREISLEYLQEGRVSPETVNELFDRAYDEGVVVDREFYDQYEELRNYLRTVKLTISPEDSADSADFNDFRKSNFGRLNISTQGGTNIDRVYQELESMWPEFFSEARESHPSDQLQHIADVAQSFHVVERNLDEYYGPEAEEFRRWARHDFEAAVSDSLSKLRDVKRYVEDRAMEARVEAPPTTQAEVTEMWGQLKQARRNYEKVMARNLLTRNDEAQVSRLLRGETVVEALDPEKNNVKGIRAVYEAKMEYERLTRLIRQWNQSRKDSLRQQADRFLQTANDWKDKKSGILYSRETMERNIRDIVKDATLAAEINQTYFKPVHDAAAEANRMKNQYRDRVRELKLSRNVEKGNVVSEAHAVQLLGEAEDDIRILEQSHGRLKERDGKNLEEWRAIVKELWEENPKLDQAKIRAAAEQFRTIYDELFQQMNEARVRNGYEPVNYRSGYFPHFQPGNGDGILAQFGKALGIDTEVTALPTTINGLTHAFRPGIRWFGNAQERLGFNTAYDAVEGFDRYIEGVADVIHQTDNIQRLRALASQARYRTGDEGIRKQVDDVRANPNLTEEDKQNRIEKIYETGRFALSNFVVELEEYTNLLANKKSRADRNMEQALGRKMYNLVKALEGRVAANMVAVNPASWLTNFIPLTQGAALLDRGMLLKGMWDTLKAYKADDGIVNKSSFLTNRRGSDPLVRTWVQKASATASRPMEYIDQFVADSLVRARYRQNLGKNMSEDAAMSEADAWVAGVMADRSKGSTPTLFNRSNPVTKVLTQFQLEVNNQLSYLFKDMPRDARDRGLAALAAALLKFFLGAWLFNEVYEYVIGRRPALDPIGILNDTVGDLTGYELPNLVELGVGAASGNLPSFEVEWAGLADAGANLAGQAVEQLPFIGGLLGGGRVPISSAIPNFGNLWNALTNEEWSAEKRLQEVRDELLENHWCTWPCPSAAAS